MKPLPAVFCLTFLSGLVFGADDARDKCQRCHESVVLRKVELLISRSLFICKANNSERETDNRFA